jgi:hypothetical protein
MESKQEVNEKTNGYAFYWPSPLMEHRYDKEKSNLSIVAADLFASSSQLPTKKIFNQEQEISSSIKQFARDQATLFFSKTLLGVRSITTFLLHLIDQWKEYKRNLLSEIEYRYIRTQLASYRTLKDLKEKDPNFDYFQYDEKNLKQIKHEVAISEIKALVSPVSTKTKQVEIFDAFYIGPINLDRKKTNHNWHPICKSITKYLTTDSTTQNNEFLIEIFNLIFLKEIKIFFCSTVGTINASHDCLKMAVNKLNKEFPGSLLEGVVAYVDNLPHSQLIYEINRVCNKKGHTIDKIYRIGYVEYFMSTDKSFPEKLTYYSARLKEAIALQQEVSTVPSTPVTTYSMEALTVPSTPVVQEAQVSTQGNSIEQQYGVRKRSSIHDLLNPSKTEKITYSPH